MIRGSGCTGPGWLLLAMVVFASPALGQGKLRGLGEDGKPPAVGLKMFASVESVQPGTSAEIAIELAVPKPWHMYHPIVLDTGLATRLTFVAPPGVSVVDVRFPAPEYGEKSGIEFLELSGTFTVLATLTVDADAKIDKAIRLDCEMTGLACVELCLPVKARAAIAIPVRKEAGTPANAELFEKARGRLAKPLATAPYLAGSSVALSKETLKPGETAELSVNLKIEKGHHIQDRDPGVEGLIGTRVFIESMDGLKIAEGDEQTWPKPKSKEMEGIGTVREHSGEIAIRIPIKLTDAKFPPGPHALRMLLQYQVCTDAGQCYAPEMAEATVRLTAATDGPPDKAASLTRHDDRQWTEIGAALPVVDSGSGAGAASSSGASGADGKSSLAWMLLFAFGGGLLLNIMPCVLPVISIKILSFVQQAGDDPKRVFRLGLAFCAGIMVWFLAFALLSRAGTLPLQNPNVVIGISSVLLLMALSLFGVFEIMLPTAALSALGGATTREGYSGAFVKGLLATLLGTACTAPLLAPALVFANQRTTSEALLVFAAAGLGMSAPYLMLTANPAWLKFVPKPGMWMVTFKQGMAFILLGTNVWLLWVIGGQLGANGAAWTVGFWCFLGFSAWLIGKIKHNWEAPARWGTFAAAILISVGGYFLNYHYLYEPERRVTGTIDVAAAVREVSERGWKDGVPWIPYTPGLAQDLARAGYTVYIDYTADWCFNCKVNKGTSLDIPSTRALMSELGVIPIEADFTREDPEMKKEINAFGRPTVPLNVILPANQPEGGIVLDVILTPGYVQENLRKAGASTAGPSVARGTNEE